MENLDGVYEQRTVACLMEIWISCVPESGAVCVALRGTSGSTMLDWEGQADSTVYTIAMVQLKV